MIYLIGGSPRTGKTSFAKFLSKKFKIPWISSDCLEVIVRPYISNLKFKEAYPYSYLRKHGDARDNDVFYEIYSSQKIIQVLKKQSKTTYKAIDNMIANEIDNGNDYVIEGYHLAPSFVDKMIKKHGEKNLKALFLTKHDSDKFAVDVHKSDTPNDWLLVHTKKNETFLKVGKMVSKYSEFFEKEAQKYKLKTLNMDRSFKIAFQEGLNYFKP